MILPIDRASRENLADSPSRTHGNRMGEISSRRSRGKAKRIALQLTALICSLSLGLGELSAQGVSQDDAAEYGKKVIRAVEDSDIGSFNDLIDWTAILNEVTSLPESEKLNQSRKDFKVEFRKATKTKDSICGAIISTVEKGGEYSLLRTGTEEGRPFALFRLILPNNGGVNFHKFYLHRNSSDEVLARDVYIYLSAEPITEIFRRGWVGLAAQILNEDDDEKNEEAKLFLANIQDMAKFFDLVNKEKNEEAIALFDQLPDETKKEKTVLIGRMRVAQRISPEDYAAVIQLIKEAHPDDPSLDFLMIDGYLLQNENEKAVECIEKTRESVGGDAYLAVMRANVLTKMGKLEEALESLKQAEQEEPTLQSIYSLGLDICLAAKDFDTTAAYLTKLEKDFGFTWKDLTTVDVFKEFTESPQYQEWLKREK